MGFRSDVYFKCEVKAYNMFKEIWDRTNCYPTRYEAVEDYYQFLYSFKKWYSDDPIVQEIENIMSKLESAEFDNVKGYGFKCIIVDEDDTFEQRFNSIGYTLFDNFYPCISIEGF